MKYYCTDCQSIIDEDELLTRTEDYGEGNYVDFAVCPYCGSDEVDEAKTCELCGEAFNPDELGNFCDECWIDLGNYFRLAVEALMKDYKLDEERARDILLEFLAEKY